MKENKKKQKNRGIVMYFRTCKRCSEPYKTSAKFGKICDNCNISYRYLAERNAKKIKKIQK